MKVPSIAFEELFLLSSHLFCHLHIFLNLHICDWQEQEYVINYAAGHRSDNIIYFTFYYLRPYILLLFYRTSGTEGMNTHRCWLTAAQEGNRKVMERAKTNWKMSLKPQYFASTHNTCFFLTFLPASLVYTWTCLCGTFCSCPVQNWEHLGWRKLFRWGLAAPVKSRLALIMIY